MLFHNLKFIVNLLADLTVALLVLAGIASIFIFLRVFKSDLEKLD